MKTLKFFLIILFSLFLISEQCSESKVITSVKLAPNPANDHLDLIIDLANDSELNILVFDAQGNQILDLSKYQPFAAGENRITIQTNKLLSGAYYVIIKTNMEFINEKFVVVH